MSILNGSNTRAALYPESTYGTNPGSGHQEIFLDSIEPNFDPGFQYLQTLVNTSIGYVKTGNQVSSVSMTGKLFKSSVALHVLLNRIFKKGTTTDTSGAAPYTHPYTVDYETNPGSFTFEYVPHGEDSSDHAQQFTGCVPTSFSVSAQQGEIPTFTVDAIAQQFTRATGPSTIYAGSIDTNIYVVGDMLTESVVGTGASGVGLKLTSGGTDHYVRPINFDFTFNTGIDENGFTLDSNLRRSAQRGGNLEATGTLDFYLEHGQAWTAEAVQALIRTGAEFSFQWRYSTGTAGTSAYRNFQLNLGSSGAGVIFDPEGATVVPDGPGVIQVSAPFRMLDIENKLTLSVSNERNGTAVGI